MESSEVRASGTITFDRAEVAQTAARLAGQGVFIGTSSWKYSGWCGMLYDPNRYLWKGKLAEKRFANDCLTEYAEVFKTVCVDAAYYKFPDQPYLQKMTAQVPNDFRFSFKVTDEITVKRFPNLARFGLRAGQPNPNFLNADLFLSAFLASFEPFQANVGVMIFEFSRFYPSDFARGRDFMDVLDAFLARLPKGWRFGVEIRNKHFLHPEYFAMLARHGVTHVYNSWTGMPSVSEQMALPGAGSDVGFTAARFLLKPGRKYQEAVDTFSPYAEVREICEEARDAGRLLIQQALDTGGREEAYLYVNNRLEGNALASITAMIDSWRHRPNPAP